MKVISTYIADDGTEFENSWECEKYEAKCRSNKFKDVALLFDEKGQRLPLTDKGFEKANFIVAKTVEAAEYMVDEFGPGWTTPWDEYGVVAGMWYYDGGDDGWGDVKELFALVDTIKKIKEACGI